MNKRALVTGGASGIGKATVERLAREGAAIAVCDVNCEACEKLVGGLRSQGARVLAVVGDVSKESDARRMVEEGVVFLGGLDMLVNNAGIAAEGNVAELSLEAWNRVIGVNLTGVFLMSKYAIPAMVVAGGGQIINIGSIAAMIIKPNHPAYCATKGAVVALTRAMAVDFASANIRVNSICPGAVETPMVINDLKQVSGNGDWKKLLDEHAQMYPMKRVGQPCEIANAVVFLASEESSFMTGAAVVVDGGYTLM